MPLEAYLADHGVDTLPPIPNAAIPIQLSASVALVKGLMRVSIRGPPASGMGPVVDAAIALAQAAPADTLVVWPPNHLPPPPRYSWAPHIIPYPADPELDETFVGTADGPLPGG